MRRSDIGPMLEPRAITAPYRVEGCSWSVFGRTLRRSVATEEEIGWQGVDHDIQDDDQEQSDLDFLVFTVPPAEGTLAASRTRDKADREIRIMPSMKPASRGTRCQVCLAE